MARSDQQKRDDEGRFSRRNRVVETVRDRPYTSAGVAALATVAAGAAAFLLTRKSDQPLMKWGQPDDDTGHTSPSAMQASSLANNGTSGIDLGKPGADTLGTAKVSGTTGIDETAKHQTKTGSVAYGA